MGDRKVEGKGGGWMGEEGADVCSFVVVFVLHVLAPRY